MQNDFRSASDLPAFSAAHPFTALKYKLKYLVRDRVSNKHGMQAICGLVVIDLERGNILHQVHVEGDVEELYDVALMPGVTCPKAFGMKANDVQRNVWLAADGRTTRFTASEN